MSFGYPRAEDISLASLEVVARKESRDSGPVLTDVSFTAQPGQMIALVGPSGAGKTTMTHLVARLYDVVSGVVRVGGLDVRDVTLQSLEDAVGYVTQDAHMFHETIRSNLLYARPEASDEAIWSALEAAQIALLIRALPDGLDTVVGDRGYRLSGGERQRLAIARLLLKAPPIVVLDEATAHLDSESEAAVQRALDAALEDRTSIVIAHRLSTIRQARPDPGGRRRAHRPVGHPRDVACPGRALQRPVPDPVHRRSQAVPDRPEMASSVPWIWKCRTRSSSSPVAPAGSAVRPWTNWSATAPAWWCPAVTRKALDSVVAGRDDRSWRSRPTTPIPLPRPD